MKVSTQRQSAAYLLTIEQAIAVGSVRKDTAGKPQTTAVPAPALETLERLRAGEDPTAGMFTIRELLIDLIEQYSALSVVELPPPLATEVT